MKKLLFVLVTLATVVQVQAVTLDDLWNDLRSDNEKQLISHALEYMGATGTTAAQLANKKDSNGNTAMANAAARGFPCMISLMVQNGAKAPDSNACGWVGRQADSNNQQYVSAIRSCVCNGQCNPLSQLQQCQQYFQQ